MNNEFSSVSMNNEFTGVDIEKIKRQIDTVLSVSTEVVYGYQIRLVRFFEKLRKYWASKNAYDFGIYATGLIHEYAERIKVLSNELLCDLYNSLQNYIKVLGLNDNVEFIYNGVDTNWTFDLDVSNTEGISGMNIRLVEDLLTNDFLSIKLNILSRFDHLPSQLYFLDEVGEQQSAYTKRIQSIKSFVEELADKLETQIRSNIENEKNNILLAKQQVVQNMNGSSTTNA